MSKASQIRQKAQEYLRKGNIDKAIEEYKRLVGVESKNPNLFNELGDVFLRAGDKVQAVANYEKAIKNYEKAINNYKKAMELQKKTDRKYMMPLIIDLQEKIKKTKQETPKR